MSKSRMPLVLGLGAAGGIGYYLYSAGGSPKAAENKFESTSPLHRHREQGDGSRHWQRESLSWVFNRHVVDSVDCDACSRVSSCGR